MELFRASAGPIPAPGLSQLSESSPPPPPEKPAPGLSQLPETPPGNGNICTYKEIRCSDGSTYTGTLINWKPHGHGTWISKDGCIYGGQWNKGKMHGEGVFKWPDGRLYTGQWNDGKMEGSGKYQGLNRREYHGEWVKGKIHTLVSLNWDENAFIKNNITYRYGLKKEETFQIGFTPDELESIKLPRGVVSATDVIFIIWPGGEWGVHIRENTMIRPGYSHMGKETCFI